MFNKLRLIWVIIIGRVIGGSNKPTETGGSIREILIELKSSRDPVNARCVCPLCNQAHSPKLVFSGVGCDTDRGKRSI